MNIRFYPLKRKLPILHGAELFQVSVGIKAPALSLYNLYKTKLIVNMADGIQITNNGQNLHFETKLDGGEYAFVEYRWHKGALVLMHTLVPDGYEGKGIAGALAKFALEYAKEKKLPLIVYCPYVAAYMKRHPEYDYLLAQGE